MTSDLIEKLRASTRRTAGAAAVSQAYAIATGVQTLNRQRTASSVLRERESKWWQHFAVLEDRYFWVLPDAVQPPARTRYLARVAEYLRGCKQVVDYGCGSGWLARTVATQTQAEVVGLDFSQAQIELARQAHAGIAGLSFETIHGPAELPRADAYIFHGLLHHLPGDEIDELVANVAARAAPGARIVVVEPTCFPGQNPDARDRALLDEIDAVVAAPAAALAARGIPEVEAIARIRAESAARWWGELPYGPSPMERPFERDELARYLGTKFRVLSSEPVQFLPASQALAGELAMLAETAPGLAAEIGPELQRRVDALERVLLRFPTPPDSGWYMNMLTAQVR